MQISFVIPAYNAEDTLAEAVDSIFDGNFESGDEVIIVNDASTDRTLGVAKKLAEKYAPCLSIINNTENKGCPASRNIGIRSARNELIFNLDADDVLASHSVPKLKEYLVEHNADLAAFAESRFFKKSTERITHKWVYKSGVITLADYLAGPMVPGGNYLYTKSSWERIKGYWEYGKGLHEFWGFTLKQLSSGSKVVVMPDSYYFHRYSHQSLFRREGRRKHESIEITNKFIKPIFNLLDDNTQKYIESNPNWFYNLEERPLVMKDSSVGETGKAVFYSPTRWLKYKIRRLIKRLP